MDQHLRILIVDDRPTTRRGLRALLSIVPQMEIVAEAANGQESVDMVAQYGPDVVLMDMQMPVMDGVEATRRIKEQWPAVRVIALTLHGRYRAEALAAGVDTFLLKEGNPEALLRAILPDIGERSTRWGSTG